MKSVIKLAAVDLDGTLLGPDKRISPENLAALDRLHAAGVEILVATGRHLTRIEDYLPRIPSARWVVTCQGAAVHEVASRRQIHAVHLSTAQTRQLIETGSRLGFTNVVYTEDLVRTPESGEYVDFYGRCGGGLPQRSSIAELTTMPAHKIIWLGLEDSIGSLPEHPEVKTIPLYQVRTHENIYEFLPTNASKALGVATVAELLGLRPGEVIAFGDADNDIPMFEWAGESFAMAHGTEGARRAASRIAPDGPPESAFARAVSTLDLPPCPSRN